VIGGGVGSKYWWEPVRVIEIIKKPEALEFPEEMAIAVLS